MKPDAEESRKFRSDFWSQNVEHNESAEWNNEIKEKISERRKQDNVMIDAVKLRQQSGKLAKWKACGPDWVYGFWIKEYRNIHEKIIKHLNKCLENGKTGEWMTKGLTCLILKDQTLPYYHVEDFHRNTGRAGLWTNGRAGEPKMS